MSVTTLNICVPSSTSSLSQ